MKVKITSDSTCDLSAEQLKKNNIELTRLIIILGKTEHTDGVDISPEQIVKFVEENKVLPKTAARSSEFYGTFFKQQLDAGYDAVVHYSISNECSASWQNAKAAAESFPNKVFVVDTRVLSTGSGLLVLFGAELAAKGVAAQEIAERSKKRTPFIQTSFVIDKLEYLHKGGRCSSLILSAANILGIRPVIEMKNGKLEAGKKHLASLKRAINKYVADTFERFNNPDLTRIFITHTAISQECIDIAREQIEKYAKFGEICETTAGCTITSHCGPGTLGILYINDGMGTH